MFLISTETEPIGQLYFLKIYSILETLFSGIFNAAQPHPDSASSLQFDLEQENKRKSFKLLPLYHSERKIPTV